MLLLRAEPDELTKYLLKVIQDELKGPAPSERTVTKVRATCLLIAARAQDGRGAGDAWQRAALRDNALRLQRALRDGRPDGARKQAAHLLDLAEAGRGDARPVDLRPEMDLDEVEGLMKPRPRGGLGVGLVADTVKPDGIEAKLFALVRRPLGEAEAWAQSADLARAAAVTAAMAQLLHAYAPDKKEGLKDPKDWRAWAGQMQAAAQELEAAARAKDPRAIRAAAIKVNGACLNCHEVFRD
jgi:hypothetical protein